MKVFFDYQIFFWQSYGGISTYYSNLINNLLKINVDAKIISPLYINKSIQDFNLDKITFGLKIHHIPRFTYRIIKILNECVFELYASMQEFDLIHSTYYKKILNFNKKKKILTVYDLIHEKFLYTKNKKLFLLKKKAIDQADHIICISKNTQIDLINYYGIEKEKTSVIYLASSFEHDINKDKDKEKDKDRDSFILYVGERARYKNFINFIKAFASSKKLLNKIKIVCFGDRPFSKEEIGLFKLMGFKEEKIVYISGNSKVLENLYLRATALVYPSLYEGFGIPIIEAMSLGCPVICSKTSSMHEISSNAAKYFDPNNLEDIRDSIENVVMSKELQNKMRTSGFQQNSNFSWKKCAEETVKVYKNVV